MRLPASFPSVPQSGRSSERGQQNIAWLSVVVLIAAVVARVTLTSAAEGIFGPEAWPWVFIAISAFLAAGVTGALGLRGPSRLLGVVGRASVLMIVIRAILDSSGASAPQRLLTLIFSVVGSFIGTISPAIWAFGVIVLIVIVVAWGVLHLVPSVGQMVSGFADAAFGSGSLRLKRFGRTGLRPLSGSVLAAIVALAILAATAIGQWILNGLVLFGIGPDSPAKGVPSAQENTRPADRTTGPRAGQAGRSGQRWFADFFNRRERLVTDEGQPIYFDKKTGQVAAAWQEKVIDEFGTPTRETVLRTVAFKPRVDDVPNRRLAQIGSAIVASIITDAVRHGNSGGGRIGQMGGVAEEETAPAAPIGTRAYIKVAMVRGMGPGEAIPASGAKCCWVIGVNPSVTNNILTRVSPENLAENIALLTQFSPAQVRDRLVVHDEELQDDPAFGDVAGIYVSFRLGGSAPATRSSAEDRPEDGLPW